MNHWQTTRRSTCTVSGTVLLQADDKTGMNRYESNNNTLSMGVCIRVIGKHEAHGTQSIQNLQSMSGG